MPVLSCFHGAVQIDNLSRLIDTRQQRNGSSYPTSAEPTGRVMISRSLQRVVPWYITRSVFDTLGRWKRYDNGRTYIVAHFLPRNQLGMRTLLLLPKLLQNYRIGARNMRLSIGKIIRKDDTSEYGMWMRGVRTIFVVPFHLTGKTSSFEGFMSLHTYFVIPEARAFEIIRILSFLIFRATLHPLLCWISDYSQRTGYHYNLTYHTTYPSDIPVMDNRK